MNPSTIRRGATIAALLPVLIIGGAASAGAVDLAVTSGAYTEETNLLATSAGEVAVTSRFYDRLDQPA